VRRLTTNFDGLSKPSQRHSHCLQCGLKHPTHPIGTNSMGTAACWKRAEKKRSSYSVYGEVHGSLLNTSCAYIRASGHQSTSVNGNELGRRGFAQEKPYRLSAGSRSKMWGHLRIPSSQLVGIRDRPKVQTLGATEGP
jgi:hypothetical protein